MNAVVHNAGYYLLDTEKMSFSKPVEIHATRFYKDRHPCYTYSNCKDYRVEFDNYNAYKVLLLSNEPCCSPNRERSEDVISKHSSYDLILCTDDDIISTCKNAVLFPYGTTWLNKDSTKHKDSLGEYITDLEERYLDKKYNVSFMATGSVGMEGYDMRQQVWKARDSLITPTVFWSSERCLTTQNNFSNTLHDGVIPNGDKGELFKSQFSIIVENCRQKNYFSEKLIDCLITKTIPIYYGCPNIDEFFDTRGILVFNTVEELIEIVNNQLRIAFYDEKKKYIEENFTRAKEYAQNFTTRVTRVVGENSQYLLTVGVLSIKGREKFLDRLLAKIRETLPSYYKHNIEIIVHTDNKEKTVGVKRNEVLENARGKYVCFIDDDDLISDNYFGLIIPELKKDIDCVGFSGNYYVQGNFIMTFNHANRNQGNFKHENVQYRPVNHLNPIRTSIARQIGFENKNCYEDSSFSEKLLESRLIKTESVIDEILYYYYFDPNVTATQV